ncbi:MAG: radical SAM family heme chaperone HemW [Bacteroides sp.]|nr:radical SAM family heme chaperone HemW [Bacteroides sp.]
MAGIYIHIPFCKTRCIYCDFYSTTRNEERNRYIAALCKELEIRKEYLHGAPIETIYLGGGTPSQLEEEDFRTIFQTIGQVYGLQAAQEITLEANPDDLTEEYITRLSRLPFNRVSIGIQTFDDRMLKLLNRRHNAEQARKAVDGLRRAGFRNISIDLIYGLPGETMGRWQQDLIEAIALDVEHISAYHLTYEEGTRLYRLLQTGQIHEVDEENSIQFFSTLTETLQQAGYEQYEISNFCRPGRHSRHNSAYWQGIPYLGCGPSAHSFDGMSREWNTASLDAYLQAIENGSRNYEIEYLTPSIRYNEYIMTALRTRRGLSINHLKQQFGDRFIRYFLQMAAPYIENQHLEKEGDTIRLSHQGIFVSDGIISDLMWVDEEVSTE